MTSVFVCTLAVRVRPQGAAPGVDAARRAIAAPFRGSPAIGCHAAMGWYRLPPHENPSPGSPATAPDDRAEADSREVGVLARTPSAFPAWAPSRLCGRAGLTITSPIQTA
jgi:hypothetical protein